MTRPYLGVEGLTPETFHEALIKYNREKAHNAYLYMIRVVDNLDKISAVNMKPELYQEAKDLKDKLEKFSSHMRS